MNQKDIHISVFADERKRIDNRWDYIGLLIIPTLFLEEILVTLIDCRICVNYNHELKFSALNSSGTGEKKELADKWIDIFIDDAKYSPDRLYFKAFGVDTDNLNYSFFSDEGSSHGTYATIYNRFFRTALHGSLKYFFPNKNIIVDQIIHDNEGHLQNHGYFDWHTIWKLQEIENVIKFNCNNVLFVDSDHNYEMKYSDLSHFIQLVDVILGAISYCLHFTNPRNKSQYLIAKKMLPLVKRIILNPDNKNSSYGYYRKYDICHFPHKPISNYDGTILQGRIYRYWSACFEEDCSGQMRLNI